MADTRKPMLGQVVLITGAGSGIGAAGAAVVWWQLRDLRKAREHSRAEHLRAEREKQQAESAPAEDHRDSDPRP